MDVAGLAEVVLTAKTALARQEFSVAMVRQRMQVDQAAVQLLTQAADQATQSADTAAEASSGHLVDIVV